MMDTRTSAQIFRDELCEAIESRLKALLPVYSNNPKYNYILLISVDLNPSTFAIYVENRNLTTPFLQSLRYREEAADRVRDVIWERGLEYVKQYPNQKFPELHLEISAQPDEATPGEVCVRFIKNIVD